MLRLKVCSFWSWNQCNGIFSQLSTSDVVSDVQLLPCLAFPGLRLYIHIWWTAGVTHSFCNGKKLEGSVWCRLNQSICWIIWIEGACCESRCKPGQTEGQTVKALYHYVVNEAFPLVCNLSSLLLHPPFTPLSRFTIQSISISPSCSSMTQKEVCQSTMWTRTACVRACVRSCVPMPCHFEWCHFCLISLPLFFWTSLFALLLLCHPSPTFIRFLFLFFPLFYFICSLCLSVASFLCFLTSAAEHSGLTV